MENHTPIGLRIVSGLLLAFGVGTVMLIATCRPMLTWAYATCEYDEDGMLYSAPVMFGWSVPTIAEIAIAFIFIASLYIFAMQMRPLFPHLVSKRFCIASVVPTGLAVWFAYHQLIGFIGEMMWMHL